MEDVKENVKETVYEITGLKEKSKEELKEILDGRGVEYHQANGEDKLIVKVLLSNPEPTEKITIAKADVDDQMALKGLEEVSPISKAELNDPSNVIVKIVLKNPKKTGSLRVRGYTHPVTGLYQELKDEHGSKRVVIIKKNEKLNLSRENDRLLYEHLKNHIYVTGSEASIDLVNTEEDAIADIERIEEAISVKEIIKGFSTSEVKDFAMLLEIPFNKTTTPAVLKSFLYKKAEESPEKVIKAWKNPDKEFRILIHRGMNKIDGLGKVIRRERGAFYYEEHLLGNSFEDCVIWLKQNEQVIPGLRKRV